MTCTFYFVSHPEVEVRPEVPVPDWPLSERGHARMQKCLRLPWVSNIGAVYASTERKATDAAGHLAAHLSVPVCQLQGLGENDRSSTGYLPPQEFEQVASAFFAAPGESVRGSGSGPPCRNRHRVSWGRWNVAALSPRREEDQPSVRSAVEWLRQLLLVFDVASYGALRVACHR